MPILSDADMVPFRELFASLACDKECTIKRPVLTNDGSGSQTETLVVIAVTNVLVQKPGASIGDALRGYASLLASPATWLIEFPYGQDVAQNDKLAFAGSSKTLTVQEILEPGSFSISTSVLAGEVA